MMERLPQRFSPPSELGNPAKDAGSHIPTATATAPVKSDATAKAAQIERFYRFSFRTTTCLSKPILPVLGNIVYAFYVVQDILNGLSCFTSAWAIKGNSYV